MKENNNTRPMEFEDYVLASWADDPKVFILWNGVYGQQPPLYIKENDKEYTFEEWVESKGGKIV